MTPKEGVAAKTLVCVCHVINDLENQKLGPFWENCAHCDEASTLYDVYYETAGGDE